MQFGIETFFGHQFISNYFVDCNAQIGIVTIKQHTIGIGEYIDQPLGIQSNFGWRQAHSHPLYYMDTATYTQSMW